MELNLCEQYAAYHTLSMDHDWRFFRGAYENAADTDIDDSEWECVSLPHTVRVEPADCSGGKNYLGEAWYRKRFYADGTWRSKKLQLEIKGAKHVSRVILNGKLLTEHYGGYLPFTIDISPFIQWNSENLLCIWLDNSDRGDIPPGKPQGSLDFCYYGGLYRSVVLHVTDRLHITNPLSADSVASGGVFVHTQEADKEKARLWVKTHLFNEHSIGKAVCITQVLFDKEERVAAIQQASYFIEAKAFLEAEQQLKITAPHLWHPNTPYLFTLYTILSADNEEMDTVKTPVGIRTFSWKEEGFFLNGERFFISGANRHQEYVYIGDALPRSLHQRDAIKLRESGFTCIRTGHYPQSEDFMDACDKVGLMCIVPTPGWQHFQDTEAFQSRSIQATREVVRWHRNHPCIILWEPILNETLYTDLFAGRAYRAVHEEYPFPDCYAAADSHLASPEIFDVLYAHEPCEGKPTFTREYGDHWIEQYGPTTTHFRCHRGERGFYPGGETGMLQSADERAAAFNKKYSQPNMAGGCLWTGIDTNRGYINNIAACGILDLFRIPKLSYYLYSSQNEPYVCIDGVQIEPMVYITKEWTAKSGTEVLVYSNCNNVELWIDDQKIIVPPTRPYPYLPHSPLCFQLPGWKRGTLKAVGYCGGKAVCEHIRHTPEAAVRLKCRIDSCGIPLIANGSDMVMIVVSAVDANGTVDTQTYHKVTASVDGEGYIVGDGDLRVGANPVCLEAGETGFLIGSTKTAGCIRLRVQADGLETTECIIESIVDATRYVDSKPLPFALRRVKQYAVDTNAIFSPPTALNWEGCPNIAVSQPVTASGSLEGMGPENITNYNNNLRWSAATADVPQWIKIDLQNYYAITGVKILWESDNTNYQYHIDVSTDDLQYNELFYGIATGQDQRVDTCEAFDVRFVRITVDAVTKGLPSICLVEVFTHR